jgi:hypothetical protein
MAKKKNYIPSIQNSIQNSIQIFHKYIPLNFSFPKNQEILDIIKELKKKKRIKTSTDLLFDIYQIFDLLTFFQIFCFFKIFFLKISLFYLFIFLLLYFIELFGIPHCTQEVENIINFFENFVIITGICAIIFSSNYKVSEFEIKLILKVISQIYTNLEVQLIILAFVAIWAYFHKSIRHFFENTLNYKMGSNFKKPSVSLKVFKKIYPATLYSFFLIIIFFLTLPIIISKIINIYDFLM